ncbi:Retrovirus-related Pol polyprotein from transposon RE1 [Vitis vinifera]|uniref:Retrovirus-related Pol polyprotein from transposon RE1 n=1 Tax=Vitis vinifera TaxID=29760 RepID=A0A438DCJ4_VITVI|nr:Retrovirus-related Pol polyprotein from transposon RE1 [Vitis vinifera]
MVVQQQSTILRQALILISQPSNALTAIRLIPPVWISHNFKATTLGMTRKTMRNGGFEPWTFRSCLGYQHFVINDNNRDQRKKDSKKTSTTTIAEIKTEANVAEKASALVAATDHGDRFHPLDLPHKNLFPQPMGPSKLKKSLYGLKQSLRAWFGKFTKSMRAFGYRQITGNDLEEKKALQNYLSREFEMKDLGPLKYFIGIEVSRSSEGFFLSQRKYALDLLQETGMSGCQPVNTPIEEGLKLCVEPNQVSTDKGRYQRLVGRLMYLAYTRPDLAYALSVVSQYMHNPGEQHMNAVMRILSAVDDMRFTSGYFTFVGGNLVTWKSKKQNVIARSSAEAEFRGMTLGLCEALWLRLLLQDLGYLSRQPIRLFCDNKFACDIAHNLVQHDRTKHVEVDRFFIKEKLDDKIAELPKIRSEDQLADILTKAVSSQVFSKFLDKLDMCDIHAPT